jgi:protein TonB
MPRMFTIVSILVHAVVVGSVFVAQVFAVGPLPIPRRPLTFAGFTSIQIVDLPPPRQSPSHSADRSEPSPYAAPVIAPEGVTPESVIGPTVPAPLSVGTVDGALASSLRIGAIARIPPPPPPPPPPQAPIRLHSGMQAPRTIARVNPVYPRIAQSARVEGVVILEAVIDAQGRVERVGVLRSIPQLDQAAIEAVKQWTFTPTLLNGVPVPIVMTVTLNFELTGR